MPTTFTLNKHFFGTHLVVLAFLSLGCSSPALGEVKSSEPQETHASPTHGEKKANQTIDEQTDTSKNTFQQMGRASWYGKKFHGRKTANGESFNMNAMTAAHRTLPFGTMVEVTDLDSGKKVIVRVNDRGPYHGGRVIDLSKKAASKLGILGKGTARVHIKIAN